VLVALVALYPRARIHLAAAARKKRVPQRLALFWPRRRAVVHAAALLLRLGRAERGRPAAQVGEAGGRGCATDVLRAPCQCLPVLSPVAASIRPAQASALPKTLSALVAGASTRLLRDIALALACASCRGADLHADGQVIPAPPSCNI
jgi:hypothetical protein